MASKMDPNLTVTPERAADDLTAYHGDREADMAALLGKEFAAEIDKLQSRPDQNGRRCRALWRAAAQGREGRA